MDENQFRILIHVIADNLNALVLGIGETLDELRQIHKTFQRMADAAEAQVKETKAMREMVERQREERRQ